jgi:hypothetical protein
MLSDVHIAVMKTYFELYLSGCMTLTELVREVGNVFVDDEGEPVHIQCIHGGWMTVIWLDGTGGSQSLVIESSPSLI